MPGVPVRREFEYRRHGTAVLFAALDVHAGDVAGWVTDSSRTDNFVAFLDDLDRQTPTGMELHCIVDNLAAHFTAKVEAFLEERPHIFLHPTPTHASWLNQVELFFSILQRRLLRYGEFDSVDDLADRVIAFINDYNRRAHTVPLDLRRPPTQSRVTHNDLRAVPLTTRCPSEYLAGSSACDIRAPRSGATRAFGCAREGTQAVLADAQTCR